MKPGENRFSEKIFSWADPSTFTAMDVLHENCETEKIRHCVDGMAGATFESVEFFPDGTYEEAGRTRLTNVSAFYRITIRDRINQNHDARISVYLPVNWNGRLWGIAGAAINTEFDWFICQQSTLPAWPMALINGYACVQNEGGIGKDIIHEWGFDEHGHLDAQWVHYYFFDAMHRMAQIAKVVLPAAYGQKAKYSYLLGCSGGGRQVVAEAQRFPEDFDGFWADCPSIDFYDILFGMIWSGIVFNNEQHDVSNKKFQLAHALVQNSELKDMEYDSSRESWQTFFKVLCGQPTPDGLITERDLEVMIKIWDGPKTIDGKQICPGFGPGIIQWPLNEERPFGYFRRKNNKDLGPIEVIPSIFTLLRWFAGDPKLDFLAMSYKEYSEFYTKHRQKYLDCNTYNPDFTALEDWGSKLLVTHGTGDFLVPYQVVRDYYHMAQKHFLNESEMNKSFCLFLLPHTGHAFYDWGGPNITIPSGVQTITDMVEKHIVPETIEAVNYDFDKNQVVRQATVKRYTIRQS